MTFPSEQFKKAGKEYQFKKGMIPWNKGIAIVISREEKNIRQNCKRALQRIKREEMAIIRKRLDKREDVWKFCSIHNANYCIDIRL